MKTRTVIAFFIVSLFAVWLVQQVRGQTYGLGDSTQPILSEPTPVSCPACQSLLARVAKLEAVFLSSREPAGQPLRLDAGKKVIHVRTIANCKPCESWVRDVGPVLIGQGWQVIVKKEPMIANKTYPCFQIFDSRGREYGWHGYVSAKQISSLVSE